MPTNLIIPSSGKPTTEMTLMRWIKRDGEFVRQGDSVAVFETRTFAVELAAPASGRLLIGKPPGYVGGTDEVIGQIEELRNGQQVAATLANAAKDAAANLQYQLPKNGGWNAIAGGLFLLSIGLLVILRGMLQGDLSGWPLLSIPAFYGSSWLFEGFLVRRISRSIHWILNDRCAKCGYDLRASANCCPECGRLMFIGPTHLRGKYKLLYRPLRLPGAEK